MEVGKLFIVFRHFNRMDMIRHYAEGASPYSISPGHGHIHGEKQYAILDGIEDDRSLFPTDINVMSLTILKTSVLSLPHTQALSCKHEESLPDLEATIKNHMQIYLFFMLFSLFEVRCRRRAPYPAPEISCCQGFCRGSQVTANQ
jgi:hypothetical protein